MIISDTYRFVFIHIPKCAGSTVRSRLQVFDDTGGAYTNRVEKHSELGRLDYVHMPLFTIKEFFPSEFKKIQSYNTFTIVRDPFARFPSSFSQHMKRYGAGAIKDLSLREVKKELNRVIDYLSGLSFRQGLLPAEYIHFQPQVDYIYLDNEKIVGNIYTVEQINILLKEVESLVGKKRGAETTKEVEAVNQAVVYRNQAIRALVGPLLPVARTILRPLLPNSVKKSLRSTVYVPQGRYFDDIFESDYVFDFINDFYRQDIGLLKSIELESSKEVCGGL